MAVIFSVMRWSVRDKAMKDKLQQFGFKIGLMLVTSLMVFATYNDILRLTRRWMHLG